MKTNYQVPKTVVFNFSTPLNLQMVLACLGKRDATKCLDLGESKLLVPNKQKFIGVAERYATK